MTQSLKQIEDILGVIGLKRQRLEAEMARLKRQDADLVKNIKTLSLPLEQSPQDNDEALFFAVASCKWLHWRERKKTAFQKQRVELSHIMSEISQDLKRITIQIKALELQQLTEQKQEKRRRDNQQAQQRLEGWINAQ